MEEEFVPYEQALAMKELSFDGQCFVAYHDTNEIIRPLYDEGEEYIKNSDYDDSRFVAAPLYQQAFRWFRNKYKLHSTITPISQEFWQYHITKPVEKLGILYQEDYYDHDEAELECLKKLIEIVKAKH